MTVVGVGTSGNLSEIEAWLPAEPSQIDEPYPAPALEREPGIAGITRERTERDVIRVYEVLSHNQSTAGSQDSPQFPENRVRIRHLSEYVNQVRAIEGLRWIGKMLTVTRPGHDVDHTRPGGSPCQVIEHRLLDVEDVERS